MELKEFIKKVVLDIEGARTEINTETGRKYTYTDGVRPVDKGGIQFDLMIASEENDGTKGEAGIKVLGMNLGGNIDNSSKVVNTNRIKFTLYTDNFN